MKKFLWILGGLIVIVVGGVLVAPQVIDWNAYKSDISAKVQELTGRELVIAGNIDAALFPKPTLIADNVSLGSVEGASSPDLIALRSVEVRIALAPLLGGNVRIENVRLVEPQIHLEVLADGRNTWTLTPPNGAADTLAESQAAGGGANGGSGPAISLDAFDIVDGRIVYRDAGAQAAEEIRDVDLNIAAASLTTGPYRAQGKLVYNGIRLGIDADIGEIIEGRTFPLDLKLGIGGDSASINLTGTVLSLDDTPRFRGDLNISSGDIGRVVKAFGDGAELPEPLRQPFSVKGAIDVSAASLALNDFEIGFGGAKGTGSVSGNFEGTPTIEADVNIDRIDADPWIKNNAKTAAKKTPSNAAGKPPAPEAAVEAAADAAFALPDNLNVSTALKIGEIAFKGDRISNVVLNAELSGGEMTLSQFSLQGPGTSELAAFGFLVAKDGKPSFDGRIETKIAKPRKLLEWAEIDVSTLKPGRPGSLSVNASFGGTPETLSLRAMKLKFDETTIDGAATVAVRDRLGIGATVNVDQLNLDQYLRDAPEDDAAAPKTEEKQSTDGAAGQTAAEPAGPFDALKPLADMDANVRASVGKLTVNGLPIRDVDADIGLVAGDLTIRSFSVGNVMSVSSQVTGAINGLGSGQPVAKALSLRAEVGDPNGLAKALGVDLPYSNKSIGKTKVAADLNGPVTTPSVVSTLNAFAATLNADGKVRLLDPANMLDLGVRMRHDDFAGLMQRLGTGYRPSGKVGGMDVSTRIKGGLSVLSFDNLAAAVGSIKVNGSGDVRLDGTRPSVTADLKSGPVTIDPFLPAERTASLRSPQAPAPKVMPATFRFDGDGQGDLLHLIAAVAERWSKVPVNLDALNSANADLTFTSPKISYLEYVLDNAKLLGKVNNGVLTVDELSGKVFGGDVMSTAAVDASGNRAKLAGLVNVGGMDIGAASKAAGISGTTGKLTSRIEVSSFGNSVSDWVRALDGKGAIEVRGIKGQSSLGDMPVVGVALGPLMQIFEILNTGLGSLIGAGANTKIGETDVISTFNIANGTLNTKDTQILSNLYKGNIQGDVNIPLWSMNIGGNISVDQGLVGALLANVARLPSEIPFQVTGDIDKPNVKIKSFQGGSSQGAGGIAVPGIDKLDKKVPGVGGLLRGLLGGGSSSGGSSNTPPQQGSSTAPPPQQAPQQQKSDPAQDLLKKLLQ